MIFLSNIGPESRMPRKSESFKVTKNVGMSFNIGINILGFLGINTSYNKGLGMNLLVNIMRQGIHNRSGFTYLLIFAIVKFKIIFIH